MTIKVEINKTGCVKLVPSNPMEEYALRKWYEDYLEGKAKLEISIDGETRVENKLQRKGK